MARKSLFQIRCDQSEKDDWIKSGGSAWARKLLNLGVHQCKPEFVAKKRSVNSDHSSVQAPKPVAGNPVTTISAVLSKLPSSPPHNSLKPQGKCEAPS